MKFESISLLDGLLFPFWADQTVYQKIYHVSCKHPLASNDNPGSESLHFLTINKAAQVHQRGEKVNIHGGTSRECVRPTKGG